MEWNHRREAIKEALSICHTVNIIHIIEDFFH